MTAPRILLVDDHALLRAGIRALLERIPGVSVVAEVDDGRAAVTAVETLHPDLVLLDIAMPGVNGLSALEAITHGDRDTKVVILSMHAHEEYVLRAMRGGAAGYLLKNSQPAELAACIEAVMRGDTYVTPGVATLLAHHLRRANPHDSEMQLTPRQREVLRLIAEGHATKDVATILSISVKTVEMHRSHLMERLHIHDVAGLVRYAIRSGLIDLDDD